MSSDIAPGDDAVPQPGPAASPDATAGAQPGPGRSRRRRSSHPPRGVMAGAQINNEIWLSVLPIAAFLLLDRVADTRIAIAAGFVAAVIVFLRTRKSGLIGYLAIGGIVIVGGAALAGIILDSDKAFFASDAIGDLLWMAAFLVSVVVGRPLIGLIVREMFPRLREWLPETHGVFVGLTIAWALENILTAAIRLVMLDAFSTDGYLLWSRVATWPLNIALFALSYYLIWRAVRVEAERRFAAESVA